MTDRSRILVVEHEVQVTRVLRSALSSNGYAVRTTSDGESALEVFGDWQPNLVVTDLDLPGLTGLELCRALRKKSDVPVIVLSVTVEERTKIEALDSGADDCVTRPFSSAELLARIRSNLRRVPAPSEIKTLEMGDFFIDLEARIVRVNKKEIRLTPKEYELLTFMARKPGKVLLRRELMAAIWGVYGVYRPECLRVLVSQLRNKVESSDSPRHILTEPWIGYRFQPSPE